MAGLSGASGRRCGILCLRRTRQPVSDPSPLTDTHTHHGHVCSCRGPGCVVARPPELISNVYVFRQGETHAKRGRTLCAGLISGS